MFDLHILGTSGSRPTKNRSVSGNYLSTPHGNLIIDCGEGFQDRLVKHELDLKKNPIGIRARISKIKVILLTHSHLDHCWGLLPLLKTMQLDGRTKPLTIIGPSTIEAIEWAENNYRDSYMKDYKSLENELFDEIKSRIKEDDSSVPYLENGYYYYTRFEKGKQYPIYCRKKRNLNNKEEILIDVNKISKGHEYFRIGGIDISPDNKIMAYSVDTISRRLYTCLLYTSPSPRDATLSRMPSSA